MEQKQFNQIYSAHKGIVEKFLKPRLYPHTEMVEEIMNDTFMKVYNHFDKFDSTKSKLSTWIITIANNTLIDHLRAVKLEKEYKKQLREIHFIKMKNEKEERIIFNNTIITCECGGIHTRSGSSNHLISNAHRNNMNIINQYLDKNDAVLRSKNIQVDNI